MTGTLPCTLPSHSVPIVSRKAFSLLFFPFPYSIMSLLARDWRSCLERLLLPMDCPFRTHLQMLEKTPSRSTQERPYVLRFLNGTRRKRGRCSQVEYSTIPAQMHIRHRMTKYSTSTVCSMSDPLHVDLCVSDPRVSISENHK